MTAHSLEGLAYGRGPLSRSGMLEGVRDLVAIVAVVALAVALGLLLPRCSLDLVEQLPTTTSTTVP